MHVYFHIDIFHALTWISQQKYNELFREFDELYILQTIKMSMNYTHRNVLLNDELHHIT